MITGEKKISENVDIKNQLRRPFFQAVPVQAKLKVNNTTNPLEFEADKVAKEVIDPNLDRTGKKALPVIQRKCEACEIEELDRKESSNEIPEVSREVESHIYNLDGKGRSMNNSEKNFFEPRFGMDFSNVKIHENDISAEKINARAYTRGNHVVFNQGEHPSNKMLMAHELTHVIQQRKGVNSMIQRAIGDGHDLNSPRFAGDTELEEIYDGNKVLERGERGGHVNKIQHAIQDKGFFLMHHGVDGIFESETQRGVRDYQQNKGISTDPIGKIGSNTMGALDSDFPSVSDTPSQLSQNPSDITCIQQLLCPWNEAIINDFRSGSRRVIFVDDLFWADEIFQGGSWQPHPMPGAGETSGNTIRLNISDDCESVTRTLYHEYQHARSPRRLLSESWADEEDYAYTLETNWSIARGLTPDPGLVTTDPISGETVIDQASLDAHVATYPGMAANEEVLSKVGANKVRVRRENGSVYVRNAAEGDTVPGSRQIVNPVNIRPVDWPTCP
jgi:hypothetical protein